MLLLLLSDMVAEWLALSYKKLGCCSNPVWGFSVCSCWTECFPCAWVGFLQVFQLPPHSPKTCWGIWWFWNGETCSCYLLILIIININKTLLIIWQTLYDFWLNLNSAAQVTLYCQKYSFTHPNHWFQVFRSLLKSSGLHHQVQCKVNFLQKVNNLRYTIEHFWNNNSKFADFSTLTCE